MKYWFFDGSDVVGPFEPSELLKRRGFAATSLVCPEDFSEDQDSWKLAGSFADFHFDSQTEGPSPVEEVEPVTDSFDEELDTLLKQRNPLGVPPDTNTEGPSLQIPKKPAKPGPIEEYFNNIKGEDLGNILGIPDPNENSDMDLARALKTQLSKTNPPTDKEIQPLENDPFDEFTTDESAKEELPEEFLNPPAAEKPSAPKPPAAPQPAAAETPKTDAQPAAPHAEEKPSAAQPVPPVETVPISQSDNDDFVLTLHDFPPAEEPAEAPAPQEPEAEPAVSSCQLPVVDQPVTEIPPLAQAEHALPPAEEPAERTMQEPSAPEADPQPAPADAAPQPLPAEQPSAVQPPAEAEEILPEPSAAQTPTDNDQPEEIVPQPVQPTPADQPAETQPEELAQPQATVPPQEPETIAPQPAEPIQQEEAPAPVAPAQEEKEPVRQILEEGKLDVTPAPELEEPIKNVPVQPEVNQVRTRLKQTPEIQNFLRQTQTERLEQGKSYKKAMAALSVLVALIAVGAAIYINQTVLQKPAETARPQHTAAVSQQPPAATAEVPQEPAPAAAQLQNIPVPPPAQIAEPSQTDKAIAIVKNYTLPSNRGTVAAYLDRLYLAQKAQGYTAAWSAEPLHKSTYIVKYRLTKTRMEPIVYVFQVDVAQGKLTGALNNITLDLVGKIQ